jgi:hypothetical protein
MALIERLMGLADDGISPAPKESEDPARCKIPVHAFFAAQGEIMAGRLTVAGVKTFLQMDTACAAEYDLLATTAPTGTTAAAVAAKAIFIEKIHSIFILAEMRFVGNHVPGYSTPAEIRSRLGI